jgi:outer membrane lipoprotein-sorting protein
MMRTLIRPVPVIVMLFSAFPCAADEAPTGRAILDRAKNLDDTTRKWIDRTQRMTLTIHDAMGGERRRDLEVHTKRSPDGEDRAISFFLAPREVQGVGFLQWTHPGREDEQWLYLPEFKRTRQISSRLRDDRFVSTDFTFNDLEIIAEFSRWNEQQAAATLVGETTIGEAVADIIELQPRLDGIPYGRLVLWLERQAMVPRKLDFHDRGGTLVKTLTFDEVRDIGAIPTPHRLEMRDHTRGSRTVVELIEVRYDTGLADDLFTQRYLDRGPP